ncbi:MAG: hybrid sensor histidine kinase/response regulator [Chitinophagaceae bacterium]
MAFTKDTIRILVVDDDEDDFFIISEYLRQIEEYKLQVDWTYKFSDAVEHLKNRKYDVYFVDYRLGAKTGLDFLKEAVATGAKEPIILLTGKGNKNVDIEAMQMGATDYLIKNDLNTDKLERCIRYALKRTSYLKALLSNERKYRSIFELSKDAVFIADKFLVFQDMNPATSDMFGYEKEELQQLSLFDLITDESSKELLRNELEEDNEVNDLELEIQTKGGDKKSCIITLSAPLESHESYQGLIHDITNLRKAERANVLVEKLGATSRLVRTLAHEVRNPLNNINLSVEQLISDPALEEASLFLDIIQRNSKRIGDLITELLDSSRPSELSFEKCTLQAVMDDAISEALDRITLQRINMQIRYANHPCYILANKEKLKIAFLNIVVNAIEAMPKDTGELYISIKYASFVHRVIIRDTGCGIPEENISRLFEPYFTSKRNGIGLGLTATLNILQSHKAHIDVNSVLNEGTTFTITFPAA